MKYVIHVVTMHINKKTVFFSNYYEEGSALIAQYFDALLSHNWTDSFIASQHLSVLEEEKCSQFAIHEQSGLHNLRDIVLIKIITELPVDDYAYYCMNLEEPTVYLVKSSASVLKNDDDSFWDGINYNIVVCAFENGERKIYEFRLPFPYTINEYEEDPYLGNSYLDKRFNNDLSEAKLQTRVGGNPRLYSFAVPSTIKVKRSHYSNGQIETISFKHYVDVVVCSETNPSDNYFCDASSVFFKAMAILARNVSLYEYFTKTPSASYHLDDHTAQAYYPRSDNNPDLYPIVTSSRSSVWSVAMSNEAHKLFFPSYREGEYNSNGQHGGLFKQLGGVYLDVNNSYTYKQLLRYYYDYSTNTSYPVGNGGQIFFHSSHTCSRTGLNLYQHYRRCTSCGFLSNQ